MARYGALVLMVIGLVGLTAIPIEAAPPPGRFVDEVKLVPGDATAGDEFGHAVGVSADTIVAGAPGDDDMGVDSGSAYVFVPDGPGWAAAAKLTASDGEPEAGFGYSVAIHGDTIVIGAWQDGGSGAAYVYVNDGSSWIEQGKLTPATPVAGGEFGYDVAVHGDTAVIAAPGMETHPLAGSVYVFVRDGTTWSQEDVISGGEDFGNSVDVFGDTLVLGAWLDTTSDFDDGDAYIRGAAYVYDRTGTNWSPTTKLLPGDWTLIDATFWSRQDFGEAVAIWEDTIVVGESAFTTTIFGPPLGGEVYAYVRDAGGSWSEQADLPPSEWDGGDYWDNDFGAGSWYGGALAIHGDVVAIGSSSKGYDMGEGGTEGVRIWARAGAGWFEYGTRTATDGDSDDRFGTSVGISETVMVAGAPGAGGSGAAYVRETTPIVCNGLRATIVGTAGDDVIHGTMGDDVIAALSGDDTVRGRLGDDVICGGDDDDTIFGNGGADVLLGERGNDTLGGGAGDDILDGGGARDTLRGQGGSDVLSGGLSSDLLVGGNGADELHGGDAADVLRGNRGDDVLFGDGGNDTLTGGPGTDALDGGGATDVCRSGEVVAACEG